MFGGPLGLVFGLHRTASYRFGAIASPRSAKCETQTTWIWIASEPRLRPHASCSSSALGRRSTFPAGQSRRRPPPCSTCSWKERKPPAHENLARGCCRLARLPFALTMHAPLLAGREQDYRQLCGAAGAPI